jgi:RNA polymerase sigma-70 factor (ECF subfamily)
MSTIARNMALDMRRLKSFEMRSKTDDVQAIVYSGNTTSEGASGAAVDVAKLLGSMDEKYRVVLEMMYLLGYTQAEIAEKLDLPLGTVKTRAKKAIDILRAELHGEKGLFTDAVIVLLGLLGSAAVIELLSK